MIKSCVVVQRKADLSVKQFKDYALNTHAKLIQSAPMGIAPRKYSQNYVFDGLYNDESDPTWRAVIRRDSIVEAWRDDIAAYVAYSASEYGQVIIPEDEKKFANTETTIGAMLNECTLDDEESPKVSAGNYKAFIFLEKNEQVGRSEFVDLWRKAHLSAIDACPDLQNLCLDYVEGLAINEKNRHAHEKQARLSGCGILYFARKEDCSCIRGYWEAFLKAINNGETLPAVNVEHCFWLLAEEVPLICLE